MAELHLGLSHSEQELRWETEESRHNYGEKETRQHHAKGKKLERKTGLKASIFCEHQAKESQDRAETGWKSISRNAQSNVQSGAWRGRRFRSMDDALSKGGCAQICCYRTRTWPSGWEARGYIHNKWYSHPEAVSSPLWNIPQKLQAHVEHVKIRFCWIKGLTSTTDKGFSSKHKRNIRCWRKMDLKQRCWATHRVNFRSFFSWIGLAF